MDQLSSHKSVFGLEASLQNNGGHCQSCSPKTPGGLVGWRWYSKIQSPPTQCIAFCWRLAKYALYCSQIHLAFPGTAHEQTDPSWLASTLYDAVALPAQSTWPLCGLEERMLSTAALPCAGNAECIWTKYHPHQ